MGGDEPSHVSSHVAAARRAGIVPRELLEIKRQEGRHEESARGGADTVSCFEPGGSGSVDACGPGQAKEVPGIASGIDAASPAVTGRGGEGG